MGEPWEFACPPVGVAVAVPDEMITESDGATDGCDGVGIGLAVLPSKDIVGVAGGDVSGVNGETDTVGTELDCVVANGELPPVVDKLGKGKLNEVMLESGVEVEP